MSSDDDLLLKLNEPFNADVEYESTLWFKSWQVGVLRNPFDGADVHGDDGHVAGERNFVCDRQLATQTNSDKCERYRAW
jgi:hypothetical protein